MLTAAMLTADHRIAVPAILDLAREREAGRRERTLTDADVTIFLATVRKYPTQPIRVYAQRGAFVSKSYGCRAPITTLEYFPATDGLPGGACISEADARRPRGKGPWVMVNGRQEG
jgi:hypothetical protein